MSATHFTHRWRSYILNIALDFQPSAAELNGIFDIFLGFLVCLSLRWKSRHHICRVMISSWQHLNSSSSSFNRKSLFLRFIASFLHIYEEVGPYTRLNRAATLLHILTSRYFQSYVHALLIKEASVSTVFFQTLNLFDDEEESWREAWICGAAGVIHLSSRLFFLRFAPSGSFWCPAASLFRRLNRTSFRVINTC